MKWVIIALAILVTVSADKLKDGGHHGHHHTTHADHAQHHEVKPEDIISSTSSVSQPFALPVQTFSPAHATPVQTFSPAHASPAHSFPQPHAPAQTYSQPAAPAVTGGSFTQHPEDQSYYYYYYPEVPKEKDLWTKIQDKFTSLFFSTSRSDLGGLDSTTTFIIIAVVAVALIVLGPSIAGLLGLTGVMAKMSVLIEKLVSATTGSARDMEVNMDDVMYYATRVFEAINKKY